MPFKIFVPPRRIVALAALLLISTFAAAPLGAQLPGQPTGGAYDVLFRNGRVLDGSGAPWVRADVAIRDGRIAAVGDLSDATAATEHDITGLYLAPGFIDTHSHAAGGLARAELSEARPLLAQGITTMFANPDGGGAADMVRQREALLEHGLGVNVAQLVPHGAIRREVLGMDDRAPSASELERMRAMVRAGMDAGAFGLSTGPYYAPGSYADTDELAALAEVAARYGGAYQSHIRDEADYTIGLLAAVEEVIEISRRTGMNAVVTHVKALGPRVWGFSAPLVHRIEQARAAGLPIFADQYPYEASATSLTGALAPRWALAGGEDSLLARIRRPADRERLAADIAENLERRGGADRIQFRRFRPDPSLEGRTLADAAAERGVDAVEATIQLLAEGGASIVSFNMNDEDIERLMRQPWTITASDGDLVPMGEGVPHPRSYGTFPRKIARYAVDRGVIDLGTAVRSMTHLPALVYGLQDRGMVREGMAADLVVFDLDRVHDPATFTEPHQLAEGMVHVLVGGRFAIESGEMTGARHGAVLRRGSGR